MKTTVIYHSADFDGIFCREIARRFIPDAQLIGWDYGRPPIPYDPESTIYILDLSPECLALTPDHPCDPKNVIWIDHHRSAIDRWPSTINGYRIDGVAACRLAWQWFMAAAVAKMKEGSGMGVQSLELPEKQQLIDRKVPEPLAVRLAGEYDIWDKRDPRAELFQHGLRSQEILPEQWRLLLDGYTPFVDLLLNQGEAIQWAKTQENTEIIQTLGFDVRWEGLTFLCCNHARYNSLLFTDGLKDHHEALMGFKWTGRDWSFSLYHAPGKEHLDLSEIAVRHGGGGHRGACGFRKAPDQLLRVIGEPSK